MHIPRGIGAARSFAGRVLSRRQPMAPAAGDRLVEDARIFLLIIDRRRATEDTALDGLVRDAFGSADRLRAAAAEARASARPAAEISLLERAAGRAERAYPPRVPRAPQR